MDPNLNGFLPSGFIQNTPVVSNSGFLETKPKKVLLTSQPASSVQTSIAGGFMSSSNTQSKSLLEQQQMQQQSSTTKTTKTLLSTPDDSVKPKQAGKTLLGAAPLKKPDTSVSNLELQQRQQAATFTAPNILNPAPTPQPSYFPYTSQSNFMRPPASQPPPSFYSQGPPRFYPPAPMPFLTTGPPPPLHFMPTPPTMFLQQPQLSSAPVSVEATSHTTSMPFVQKILHLNQAVTSPALPPPSDKPLFPAKQQPEKPASSTNVTPQNSTPTTAVSKSENIITNMVNVHSVFSTVQPPKDTPTSSVTAPPVRYISTLSSTTTTTPSSTSVTSTKSAMAAVTSSTNCMTFPSAAAILSKDFKESKPTNEENVKTTVSTLSASTSFYNSNETKPVTANKITISLSSSKDQSSTKLPESKVESPIEMAQRKFKAIIDEEEEFEASCKDWMKQYHSWLKENENHPNKKQFYEYKKEWTNYIEKMQKKRTEIGLRKTTFKEELCKLIAAQKKAHLEESKKFEPTEDQVLQLKKKAEEMRNLYKQKEQVQKLQQSIKINIPSQMKTLKTNDDAKRKSYRGRKTSGSSSSSSASSSPRSRSRSKRRSRSKSRSRSPVTRHSRDRRRSRSRNREQNWNRDRYNYNRRSYERSSDRSYRDHEKSDRWGGGEEYEYPEYEPEKPAPNTGASEVIDYGHGRVLGTRFVPGAAISNVETWQPEPKPEPKREPSQSMDYSYVEDYSYNTGAYYQPRPRPPRPPMHPGMQHPHPQPRGYPRFGPNGVPLRRPPPPQHFGVPRHRMPPPQHWHDPSWGPRPRGPPRPPPPMHHPGAGGPRRFPPPAYSHEHEYAEEGYAEYARPPPADPRAAPPFPPRMRQPFPPVHEEELYYEEEAEEDHQELHTYHPPPPPEPHCRGPEYFEPRPRPPRPGGPFQPRPPGFDGGHHGLPPRGPPAPAFSRPLGELGPHSFSHPAPPPTPVQFEVVPIDSLLKLPRRENRPNKILVIMRGLPGSGKTMLSKLIKEKEVKMGASAPRILCLDDFFTVDGVYEYEPEHKNLYEANLLKAFKRQVDLGYFSFIILDCVNDNNPSFQQFMVYGKMKGYTVYFLELDVDPWTCYHRNLHGYSLEDIQEIKRRWEPIDTPYLKLDATSLLQEISINEVEMEDEDYSEDANCPAEEGFEGEEEDVGLYNGLVASKWDLEAMEDKMVRLDGLTKRPHKEESPQGIAEYLQLDLNPAVNDRPGQKRVRWADLEEMKAQCRRKQLGFVVGQTDWNKLTSDDSDLADQALNQTKYF